jgi:hypothetical protein
MLRPLACPDKEEVVKACLQRTIKGIAYTRMAFSCVSFHVTVLCILQVIIILLMTDYDECHKAIALFSGLALSSQK